MGLAAALGSALWAGPAGVFAHQARRGAKRRRCSGIRAKVTTGGGAGVCARKCAGGIAGMKGWDVWQCRVDGAAGLQAAIIMQPHNEAGMQSVSRLLCKSEFVRGGSSRSPT
eukprot:362188-Chlamydomonas_euryale.AAC.6